ncbi:MAG: right-handed parallel beta-helix repeat-containing protein [Oscillospiraceae bacterium]|nr:right-handed parallel beta-helix repeat-containing protein [Oscillospiraceae bacterium]
MKEYNILDFGACVSDRLQTKAIQSAIDACFLNGGGRVVVPCGIFRTGGIRLRSDVELYLKSGAILKGSRDPDDYDAYLLDEIEPVDPPYKNFKELPVKRSSYAYSRWCNGLIRAIHAKNIAITGEPGSYIDGSNCYDPTGEEDYRGPHAISMWYCENITLRGYTVTDSANWAHAIFVSQNITARELTVYGGHDGFDIRTCDNVSIEDCEFYTGDDCITGFDDHDVVIRNCVMDSGCSAMRFGGNNVLVEDCRIHAPSRFGWRGPLSKEKMEAGAVSDETCRHDMVAGFMYYCDFRAVIRKTPGDILIRRCTFDGPDRLFTLDFDGEHVWCCNRSLSSITFEDCTVTGVKEPIHIHGDENEPLTMTLKNMTVSAKANCGGKPFIDAFNFAAVELENVVIEGYNDPTILVRSQGIVKQTNGTEAAVRER